MQTDLTRARRKLAMIKRRHLLLNVLWCNGSNLQLSASEKRLALCMAREFAREIAVQELEVRRLALTGPWKVVYGIIVSDDAWYAQKHGIGKRFRGPNAKARAVAWAERMNRKEQEK